MEPQRSQRRQELRRRGPASRAADLLPALYPGVFPNLAALNASKKPRADIEAILLTGLPSGVVPGFQNNTGKTLADMLRLNVAVPPERQSQPAGSAGQRRRRIPERTPGHRRHRDDRAAGTRRSHLRAGRQVVHPRTRPRPRSPRASPSRRPDLRAPALRARLGSCPPSRTWGPRTTATTPRPRPSRRPCRSPAPAERVITKPRPPGPSPERDGGVDEARNLSPTPPRAGRARHRRQTSAR